MPGILAWAVRGCVEWVEHGLGSARAVDTATAEYRAETDTLEQFFEERCYFYPEARVTRSDLYHAWEEWCDEMGEHAGTQTRFTRTLNERGVVKGFEDKKIDDNTRGWRGISLVPPFQSVPQSESVRPKNPCKDMGSETPNGHFEKNFQEVTENPPRVEGFLENGEKVSDVSESVRGPVRPPSEDDYVEPPAEFNLDGVTVRYGTLEKGE